MQIIDNNKFIVGSIRIKRNAKYITQGLPWVYSNEVIRTEKNLSPGSWVSLLDEKGSPLGYGFYNPHSLIAYRSFLKTDQKSISVDSVKAIFFSRIRSALELRRNVYSAHIHSKAIGEFSFRLCFGESDGLAGLVVDLFHLGMKTKGYAVVQCHAAGADTFIPWVQEFLKEHLQIECGVVRNDLSVRTLEKAPQEVISWGKEPESVHCLEGGVWFGVQPITGQKTGYFYDHRDNRFALSDCISKDKPVEIVDCFSYTGSWGLQLLKQNPLAKLTAIDVSQTALDELQKNAEQNGLEKRVKCLKTDFFEQLPIQQKFDVVICDPPAVTSSAKHKKVAQKALGQCFKKADELTKPNGITVLASCSYHIGWSEFEEAIAQKSPNLQLFFFGSQAKDHPVLASMSSSRYLKCVFGRKQN
ncbi:MAG: class I SAM-dependent rRNA methyltransferase [Bacteriovoracia bacterium]